MELAAAAAVAMAAAEVAYSDEVVDRTFHVAYHQWAELRREGEEPVAVTSVAMAAILDPLKIQ